MNMNTYLNTQNPQNFFTMPRFTMPHNFDAFFFPLAPSSERTREYFVKTFLLSQSYYWGVLPKAKVRARSTAAVPYG